MTELRTRALGFPLLMLCSLPAAAVTQGARAESNFPFEPLHASTVALGGAGAALQGMAFSSLNPAASAGERGAEASHRASPIGARDYLISVGHGGGWGTVRATARRRDWGQIARDLGLPDLTVGEQTVAVTFADRAAGDRLAWGVSLARLDADYLGARTGTWSMDVGTQVRLPRGVRIGAGVLHLGNGFRGDEGRSPLPTRLRPGVAWQGRIWRLQLAAAVDLAVPPAFDSPPDVHTGAEVHHTTGPVTGALRAGYRSLVNRDGSGSRRGDLALGGGLRIGWIAADIAYSFGAVFGDERFVSLSVIW